MLTDKLWGGQLTAIDLDPVTHSCELRVDVVVNGRTFEYGVACIGVTDFQFHNGIPVPWDYAEATEFHAAFDGGSRKWLLDVMLWSEDAGLTIRCAAFDVVDKMPL